MGPIFTPPDTSGVVQFPGTRGGAEWGGASFDPETGVLYVNANEIPLLIKMKPIPVSDNDAVISPGEKIYTLNNCTMCHGSNTAPVLPYFPALQQFSKKFSKEQIATC